MASPQELDQPQVQQAPVPGVKLTDQASLASFGGGPEAAQATEATKGLADTAADVMWKKAIQQHQLEGIQANYAANDQLAQLQSKLLHGDPDDPQNNPGVLNLHGQNAVGSSKVAMAAWQKGAAAIDDTLTEPEQKIAFQRLVSSYGIELYRSSDKHESDERVQTTIGTLNGSAMTNLDSATKNALIDPATTQMHLARARAAIAERANLEGLSGDARDTFIKTQMSSMHLQVLETLIDGQQDLKAEQYFKDHGNEFFKGDYKTALAATQRSSTLGESFRQLDLITQPDAEGNVPTVQEARAEAAKIQNPKVRAMATDMIIAKYKQDLEDQRMDVQQAYMKSSQILSSLPSDKQDLLKAGDPIEAYLPSALWSTVSQSPEHIASLRAEVLNRSKPSDAQTRDIELPQLESDQVAFGKMDWPDLMQKYGSKLNYEDRKNFEARWVKAHNAILENASHTVMDADMKRVVIQTLSTFKQPFSEVLPGTSQPFEALATGNIKGLNMDTAKRLQQFESNVALAATAERNAKGRPLNDADRQKIVDSLLVPEARVKLETSRFGFRWSQGEWPAAMALPGELLPINDADRKRYIDGINKANGTNLDWQAIPDSDPRLQARKRFELSGSR